MNIVKVFALSYLRIWAVFYAGAVIAGVLNERMRYMTLEGLVQVAMFGGPLAIIMFHRNLRPK